MKGLFFLSLLAAGIFFARPAQAQHYNAWFRTTLSYPVQEKIRLDNEFQHRRQSGADNDYLVSNKLMFTARSWLHYQHNENVRFSLSPFACFNHYRVIETREDEKGPSNREYRVSAAMDWQTRIAGSIYLVIRNAVEYRMFKLNPRDITRVRNRSGIRYDIDTRFKISVYDELFVNLSGTDRYHYYDHNRIGFNLEYNFPCNCKMEAGYIFIDRLLPYNDYVVRENNFFLNLTWQLTKSKKH